ncbi:MAG: transposase [Rhodospirillales bacterium]|jgi:transposase InsO family protein|nr:transposase [Rhodospirillales bacterium]
MSRRQGIQRCRGQDSVHQARSPWENGYVESFNGKLRDELLNAEVFHTLAEAPRGPD